MKKFLFLLAFLLSCSKNEINSDLIVKNFDLNKYLGTWYEVARYDNWFEKNLINVKAEYTLLENSKVKIVNSGYNSKSKKNKSVNGIAYLPVENLGQLRVSFFRPFYSDYNIIFLDKEYQYAVVVGGQKDYLWILSRSPKMSEALYEELLIKIQDVGFDVKKIVKN